MHSSTYEYYKPTDVQVATMACVRASAANYSKILEDHLPDGPDKTYAIRKLREVAIWANIAITRQADGSPRSDT